MAVISSCVGKVWLVGAGPGDPDLLTMKAWRIIQNADLILCDYLVSDAIRALFPKSAQAFYVGKKKGSHSIAQGDLNSLLVKQARAGKNICRLKGGDPFIFGRGGEELATLIEAGIPAEVIPGVTAASGCSTYAGIPLTHRGLAQGCTYVTAHGDKELDIDWQALVNVKHTLVFYMGLSRAEMIRNQLKQNGMPQDTPAAIIVNGCRDNQQVLSGVVADLPQLATKAPENSPALIVVGQVVSLAEIFGSQQRARSDLPAELLSA